MRSQSLRHLPFYPSTLLPFYPSTLLPFYLSTLLPFYPRSRLVCFSFPIGSGLHSKRLFTPPLHARLHQNRRRANGCPHKTTTLESSIPSPLFPSFAHTSEPLALACIPNGACADLDSTEIRSLLPPSVRTFFRLPICFQQTLPSFPSRSSRPHAHPFFSPSPPVFNAMIGHIATICGFLLTSSVS